MSPRRDPGVAGGGRVFYGRVFALVAAGIVGLLVWRVVEPLLLPLCWALIAAILLHPVQQRLALGRGWRPSVAAGVLTVLVFVVLAGPVSGISAMFGAEVGELVEGARERVTGESFRIPELDEVPVAGGWLERLRLELGVSRAGVRNWLVENLNAAATALGPLSGRLVVGILETLTGFAIMMVLLFFALRDGGELYGRATGLVPWPLRVQDRLARVVGDVLRSVVIGAVATAALQGLLVGLAFAVIGLPAPVVLGVAAGLLAMLPVGGTAFVWGPAVLFLALDGRWPAAIGLALWGTLLVGTIDNLLRPWIVAHRARVGSVTTFVGIIGGLAAFGLIGLVVGPLVLVLAGELLKLLREPGARHG